MRTMTFALYFGNRGFFPETLIAGAREEMSQAVRQAGYTPLLLDADATRYGAVETREEGRAYARFLKEHAGEYDGVILCLPNFGDENGAIEALRDCGTPILIQAYPDEIGKMDFEHRRDAYCGKFSIEDVFTQYGLSFTVMEPHVVHPLSDAFARNLADFAAVCRVVGGMKRFSIGAIGARTTKFKTVRYDELALQKAGITVDTFDLSDLFARVRALSDDDSQVVQKVQRLAAYTDCSRVPADKLATLAKVSAAIDQYLDEYHFECVSLRCWEEMQSELGIAPCVLLSELNDRGVVASCEMDLCNAVGMYALQLATEGPAMCLDWNNNYGDDPDKVILFHCGPIAQSLMEGPGTVTDHKMFAKANPGCGWGSNEGRIAAFPMTYSCVKTENGRVSLYLGEGRFTGEPIEAGYFGCGGVAQIPGLQKKLLTIGRAGFRHHCVAARGHVEAVLREAFQTYLGYDLVEI